MTTTCFMQIEMKHFNPSNQDQKRLVRHVPDSVGTFLLDFTNTEVMSLRSLGNLITSSQHPNKSVYIKGAAENDHHLNSLLQHLKKHKVTVIFVNQFPDTGKMDKLSAYRS